MNKKYLIIAGFSLLLLASCKKKGSCTCEIFGTEVKETYEDMDKDEYDTNKKNCEDAGCTWSNKL